MCIYPYICACVCVCVCVRVYCLCTCVYEHVCMHLCLCLCVSVCAAMCVCLCVRVHNIYICIMNFSYFDSACQGPLYLDLLGTCHQETMKPAVLLSKHVQRYHTHVVRGFSFYPPEVCTVVQGLPWFVLLSSTKHT